MKTMSYDEVKEKLAYHDDALAELDDLKLGVFRTSFDPSGEAVVFLALIGSPPGGYGIFIGASKQLMLYNKRGVPVETITVDELASRYTSLRSE